MFLLFVTLSVSVHLGIDLGSYFTKSTLVTSSENPEIALNYQTKRITPTFVGFRAKPSFRPFYDRPLTQEEIELLTAEFGEKAINLMELRPWMGSGYFPAFVGLSENVAKSKADTLMLNLSAARLSYNELFPMFMKAYIDCVTDHQPVERIDIVVPADFSTFQRNIISQTLTKIGHTNSSIIDDVTAMTHTYSLEKTPKFTKKANSVLFVDVGATTIKAYVVKFEMKNGIPIATRLSYAIDHENGGAYVTAKIVDLMKKKFNVKNHDAAEGHRMFTAAEKIKNQLTLLPSSVVIIDNLNGFDRSFTLTREELENEVLKSTIVPATLEVMKQATNGIKYNEIEIVGGSSRFPLLLSTVQSNYKSKTLGKSLNADEALAFGAGYAVQYEAKLSAFKPLVIFDENPLFSVKLNAKKNISMLICEKGKTCKHSVSINTTAKFIQLTNLQEEFPENFSVGSLVYELEDNANSNLTIHFATGPLRITSIIGCDEENCTDVPYKIIEDISTKEYDLIESLVDAKARKEKVAKAHNDLEALCLKVLDEIAKNETVRTFSNYSQRLEIIRATEKQKLWLRGEGQNCINLSELLNRTLIVKKKIGPVYRRISENNTVINALSELYNIVEVSKYAITQEWPVNKTYLDKRKIFRFYQHVNKTEKFLNETIDMVRSTPPTEFYKVKASVLKDKYQAIYKELESIDKEGTSRGPSIYRGGQKLSDEEIEQQMGNTEFYKKFKDMQENGFGAPPPGAEETIKNQL